MGMLKTTTFTLLFLLSVSGCAHKGTAGNESTIDLNPLTAFIQFYQGPLNHLEAVKRSECPMYPSCSSYSLDCLKEHGIIMGWLMTCDRLMRCGRDELKYSPGVYVNGGKRCYDPVDSNDFWWKGEGHQLALP